MPVRVSSGWEFPNLRRQGQAKVHPAWRDTSINFLFTKYDDEDRPDFGSPRQQARPVPDTSQ
ncbi:MAG: hypothetical protein V2A77_04510, partial [Pseudomonadota bacterium]